MKKLACVTIVLLLILPCLFAQQGEYQRKSVSAIGSVWIGPEANSWDFDSEFFALLIDEYIEISRFDFNQLSGNSIQDFRQRFGRVSFLDTDALGSLLEETVGQEISNILSDPEIQKARMEGLKDESARVQLASTKGREFGLTEEQLASLMNSAYLYLPYVSKITSKRGEDDPVFEITGGILWYQVLVSPQGQVSMKLVESASAKGEGPLVMRKSFRLGTRTFKTTFYQYTQYSSMQAWVKNLAVIMKRIPDFSLSAQIMEKLGGGKFSSTLGRKDGVFLDDGFYVIETFEDTGGNLKRKRIGYGRLVKNVDNRESSGLDKLSVVKLHYGKRVMPGALLDEDPRLGLEIAVTAGPASGMNIPADMFPSAGVNQPAEAGLGFNIDFSYNLAPIIGITQTFIDLDVGMVFPEVEDSQNETSATVTSVHTGFTKKLWLGRHGLALSARGGLDLFNSSMESNNVEYSSNAMSLGARLGASYVLILSPSFQLTAGYSKSFSMEPLSSGYKIGQTDFTVPDNVLEELDLGNTRLNFGFNWRPSSFGFDVFGWLDPLKKH